MKYHRYIQLILTEQNISIKKLLKILKHNNKNVHQYHSAQPVKTL